MKRNVIVVSLLATLMPAQASAQEGGWDSPRVLEMIEQARVRRALPYEDSALRNYAADAHGYIYFYLDREEEEELTLVKVDQVALEVYWAYPGSTKQRIIGLRDESLLPNRMRYHLDHLTVVQNEFGDRIQLGDGDEVQSVVHPVAPDSELWYHFRVADSLTLRLGGLPEPLRVYEIEVRPRDPTLPGIVGSIFLDAAAFDIVRMDFTFTRDSYVDRRLDYIRISLENGLWEGRFWLPFEQRVELRRQLPELDFPAGAVIRGHMQVRDYEFNLDLPQSLFRGPAVTSVPRSTREAYPFEDELFAELAEEGLAPDPDLEALREDAAGLIGRRFLEGLPPLRLDLRGASSVLRFDRTERLHLGLGFSYRIAGGAAIARAGAGYSFGTEEPTARVGFDFDLSSWDVETRAWWNQPRDLGWPAAAGVMNTLSALAAEAGAEFGHDFRDTWFSRGASIGVERPVGLEWGIGLTATFEDHRAPGQLIEGYEADEDDELNRPLAIVESGRDTRALFQITRNVPAETAHGWDLRIGFEGGLFDERDSSASSRSYGRFTFDWEGRAGEVERDLRFLGRVRFGGLLGAAPIQNAFLLGGMGTVPGYAFRSYGGDVVMLMQVEARQVLRAPWVSGRLSTAVGVIDMTDEDVAEVWPHVREGTPLGVGAGIGLVNEILWIDVWHGAREDGDWEVLLTVDPRLWDIL